MTACETVVPTTPLQIPGYEIIREIGRGGMATVYLAVQQCFGRHVALKIMSPALAADAGFSQRFLREARIIAGLSHPHIIGVHDVGKQGHHHYYAMDYHPGHDLKHWIAMGLRRDQAVAITKQLALALDHAHRKGYIHRDVKPDNILLREDGSAILTDFGIARATFDDQVTQSGKIIGTPKYMSPEQAKGKSLDARSDLYSLGIVFYEMLTGRPPFTGEDPIALGIQHLKDPVPPLQGDLDVFQPILDRLLAKEPEQRYQNGEALIEALESLEFANGDKIARSGRDTVTLRTPVSETQRIKLDILAALDEINTSQMAPSNTPPTRRGLLPLLGVALLSALITTSLLRPDLVERVQALAGDVARQVPIQIASSSR